MMHQKLVDLGWLYNNGGVHIVGAKRADQNGSLALLSSSPLTTIYRPLL